MTKLPRTRLLALFLLGALVSPLGDHIHVSTGTTTYFDRTSPFVWDSPLWFPLSVGLGTAALAEIRSRLGSPRARPDLRWAVGGLAALMAIYALTGMLRGQPAALGVTLIGGLAALVWSAIGDGRGAVCGVVAAVVGTAVEAVMVAGKMFEYAADSNQLLGVAPWLPALYFTFGVVVSVVGEVLSRSTPPPQSACAGERGAGR